MLLLRQRLNVELVSPEHPPLLVRDQLLERARVVYQIVQLSQPLLANPQCDLEHVWGHARAS